MRHVGVLTLPKPTTYFLIIALCVRLMCLDMITVSWHLVYTLVTALVKLGRLFLYFAIV